MRPEELGEEITIELELMDTRLWFPVGMEPHG